MEFGGTLAGGLSGSMHFGSDGDTIDIDPILTSGEKIATFTVNAGTEEEVVYDLYAPNTLSWDDITDKPTLFSGVYGDLSSKPTLDGNVINGNMFTHNYSASERRVGTWIDGKPLYQKTFDLSVSISSTSRTWYIVLSASDVQAYHMDKIFIDQEASYAIDPDDGTLYPIPYSSVIGNTGGVIGWCIVDGAVKLCMSSISIGTMIGKMTLRYTKTTD